MSEWEVLITEWITEYSNLQENELKSFAAEHEHNHEIAAAVFGLLIDNSCGKPDETANSQVLNELCMQLFSFYRSKEIQLQRFALQFIPTLIYLYLSAVAQGNNKSCRSIETLLIGIYNIEVVDETGKPKVVSFRLPSLAQASIYHEPLSLGPQFLTESALRRWEECNTKLVTWGPLPQVEIIHTQNRLKVMAALLFVYNQQLSLLPKLALRYFCIATSSIVTQGFQKPKDGSKPIQRIPVKENFLIELIQGTYFAMYNEFFTLGFQAIKDIDLRAQYELFPDVMVVTSAVINSLHTNSAGAPCDGPMGISVALSPASTTTVTMSKSMITNASFRTKKLPDDIPIQAGQIIPTESSDVLSSITEEGETDSAPLQRGSIARTSKPKLTSFPILGKKKDSKDKSDKKVTLKDAKGARNSLGGTSDVDSTSPLPQKKSSEITIDVSNTKEERMSMTSDSLQTSLDNSDSRSQITTDSLDTEPVPRLAPMQVSSV